MNNLQIVVNDKGNMLDVELTKNGVPVSDWGTPDPVEAAAFILWEFFAQHEIDPVPWTELMKAYAAQAGMTFTEPPPDLVDDIPY